MSLVHSMFGLGLIMPAVVSGIFESLSLGWRYVFLAPALFQLLVIVGVFLARSRGGAAAAMPDRVSSEAPLWPAAILVVALTGIQVGIDASVISWSPTYWVWNGNEILSKDAMAAALAIAISLGRFLSSRIVADRHKSRLYLSAGLTIVAASVALTLSSSWIVTALCIVVLGFGMSDMFPILASYAGAVAGKHADQVYVVMSILGSIGGAIIPPIIGTLSETQPRSGMSIVLIVIAALCVVGMSVLVALIRRRRIPKDISIQEHP